MGFLIILLIVAAIVVLWCNGWWGLFQAAIGYATFCWIYSLTGDKHAAGKAGWVVAFAVTVALVYSIDFCRRILWLIQERRFRSLY